MRSWVQVAVDAPQGREGGRGGIFQWYSWTPQGRMQRSKITIQSIGEVLPSDFFKPFARVGSGIFSTLSLAILLLLTNRAIPV